MGLSKVSLRYKIMGALTALPLAGLSLFLFVAVGVFEKDKIAYVYESSLAASQTRAARVGSETQALLSLAQSIVVSYRADSRSLDPAGHEIMRLHSKVIGFQVYAFDPATATYVRAVDSRKNDATGLPGSPEAAQALLMAAKTKSVYVQRAEGGTALVLAARFGNADDPKHVIALGLFNSAELADSFSSSAVFSSFLVQGEGTLVFGDTAIESSGSSWSAVDIWEKLASARKAPEGIAEITSPGGRPYLASFVSAGVSDLAVVSIADKKAALGAIDSLLRASFLLFVATASLTVIISVLAARGLTRPLVRLMRATQEIASGDFGVRVVAKGGDEIGRLGASFNVMAEEISRLIKETAEKARMETELATAKAVQETLFPPSHARLGNIDVSGHYQPASECGGDWWHYCENGTFVYLWIGDATGHGAPAALLTSAARAVASVIEMGEPRSPGDCLGVLNRAIWDSSKGKMMMTFFLAAIEKRTGIMYYSNASHEAPLLLRRTSQEPTRDDYLPLNEVNNPRLGESPVYDFAETHVVLSPGDRIVFYTDGVVDVKNPESKVWGERRFVKALTASLHQQDNTEVVVGNVVAELQRFRQNQPLDDDVTLILAQYSAPSGEEAA